MGDIRSARGKHLAFEGDITDEGEETFHPRAPAGRSQRLGTVPPFRDQPEDGTRVQAAFEEIFDEFGLPNAIRTDNGPSFASARPGLSGDCGR